MNNTSIIIRREYLERVNKKTFIVTTIVVPIVMLAMMILPTALMVLMPSELKTVAVIDDSGLVLPGLESTDDVRFIPADMPQGEMLANDSIYGVLVIDRNILANPDGVRILTPNAASVAVESEITSQMEKIIETHKLKAYNIENLDAILDDVRTTVKLQSIRVDADGDSEGETQSAELNSAAGMVLNFVLYMFLILYGGLVMNSIVEEKGNRVLELVVSSVKPTQLMLGKIIGVGLVAFTQIVIWGVILIAASTLLLPVLMPAGMESAEMEPEMAHMFATLTDVGYMLGVMGLLLVFLIGGYLLYASIFAAIGASVDNLQDASQLQMLGLMPIMIGLFASMAVIADPNSTFATVMSLIPFTSPMVMMTRVPFGIPGWEIALSVALLALTIVLAIYIAAKIYRVGIFMYGKKPSVRDLIRWARYK